MRAGRSHWPSSTPPCPSCTSGRVRRACRAGSRRRGAAAAEAPRELRLRSGATCPVRLQLGRRWPRPPRKTGTLSLPRATMCLRQSRRQTLSLTICRSGRETVRSRESRRPPPSPSGQPEGIPQQDQGGGPDFPLIMRDFPLCSIVSEYCSAEPRTVPKVGNGVDVPERPQKHRPGATGKTFPPTVQSGRDAADAGGLDPSQAPPPGPYPVQPEGIHRGTTGRGAISF